MITTKGANFGKQKTPFVLKPGQIKGKIKDVTIKPTPYRADRYFINFLVVGPEIPDFEGFTIDATDPSKGKFKSQIARPSLNTYVKNTATDNERDLKMIEAIVNLIKPLGLRDEVDEIVAENWEEFGEKLKQVFLKHDKEYFITLSARKKDSEYDDYDRYTFPNPDYSTKKYPVALTQENALPFDESKMVEVESKVEEVDSFDVNPYNEVGMPGHIDFF